jgi:hypothetical protein
LSSESAAARELQSRLAADDLALKRSIADMQNAKDGREYALALRQFEIDKQTTEFNKMLSLVMAGVPLADAQKTALSYDASTIPTPPAPGQSPQQAAAGTSPQTNAVNAMYESELKPLTDALKNAQTKAAGINLGEYAPGSARNQKEAELMGYNSDIYRLNQRIQDLKKKYGIGA